jgi:hypothetical protein
LRMTLETDSLSRFASIFVSCFFNQISSNN